MTIAFLLAAIAASPPPGALATICVDRAMVQEAHTKTVIEISAGAKIMKRKSTMTQESTMVEKVRDVPGCEQYILVNPQPTAQPGTHAKKISHTPSIVPGRKL